MATQLRLVSSNNLDRFSREWRRGFASGRRMTRLLEASYQATLGNRDESARQFEIAARIAP